MIGANNHVAGSKSSQPLIEVDGLSKLYLLYDRPQDRLKQSLFWRFGKSYGKPFWALKDVAFKLHRGQTIGIIGRNGSGKSTLLQIIAGTLQPTAGQVAVTGRVAALLELGSGFNPEYTGRENVFLGGSIWGLDRTTMRSRLQEVIDFADIGQFIDQPIKVYSSGMFVRLAFAIQTVLHPDVLIIDEALSVGDAYFVQKCLRWIREFRNQGNGILFVTHDPVAAKTLCDEVIWLDQGRLRERGEAEPVVSHYLAHLYYGEDSTRVPLAEPKPVTETAEPETSIPNVNRRFGDGRVQLLGVGAYDAAGNRVASILHGSTLVLRVTALFRGFVARPIFGYTLRDRLGTDVAASNTSIDGIELRSGDTGQVVTIRYVIKLPQLQPGHYAFAIAVADGDYLNHSMCDWIDDALVVTITAAGHVYGMLRMPTDYIVEGVGDGSGPLQTEIANHPEDR